jgi:hypothetical protein
MEFWILIIPQIGQYSFKIPCIPIIILEYWLADAISLLKSSFLYIFNNSILQAILREELLWIGKNSLRFALSAETRIYIMKLAGMQVLFITARNVDT